MACYSGSTATRSVCANRQQRFEPPAPPYEESSHMNLNIARTEPALARANGIELTYDTFGDAQDAAAGADHGPGGADDRLGRRVLRRAGGARVPRHPLRQP